MRCPNCQFENQQGAKFCSNCGTPLSPDSPGASSQADLTEKGNYSQPLPPILSSMPNSVSKMEGERRVVTILFCDLKGSTAMAEHLDPEEWAEIMNEVFKHLIEPVNRYGGTVARLLGDAILAFFGAPKAHEDDPLRAVLAGQEIVSEIHRFNEQSEFSGAPNIEVRVGIHTGLVVVGEIDSGFRSEYTAMGDAVNLAARMEQTAKPGTVQISEETYRLVAPHFEFEALGSIEVKGKTQPVQAYRILGLKGEPDYESGIFGFQAPLIGRSTEMKRLREAMSLVKLGRGQIVCLGGEAGIGKSRLIHELKQEWFASSTFNSDLPSEPPHQKQDNTWRETRSISYANNLPYGTFNQLVRNLCGASPVDSVEAIREKIACNCLSSTAPEEQCQRVSQAFEVLLGIQAENEQVKLEGKAFKDELFEVMTITWRDWTTKEPSVLVFDDLQWADPASVELLIYLFNLVETVPILFLCAFRPDRDSPAWQIKQTAEREYPHRYTEIFLDPLTQEESQSLVNSLLISAELPPALRSVILEKSEGNPFFVEQIVHSLVETGVIVKEERQDGTTGAPAYRVEKDVKDITIPDTVQALLQARMDRLDEETRQTLQKAAVIGRSFYHRVLSAITDPGISLDKQLTRLERARLILEAARIPELEYVFSHALAQETAYKSVLRRRRRHYHFLVGEAIETIFSDRLEEAAPLLAYHFHEAADPRALHYYSLAGDKALHLYANKEAIVHYRQALTLAKQSRQTSHLMHIYTHLGRALELNAQYDQAEANYVDMERTAQNLGDQALLLAALLARAVLHSAPSSISNPDTAWSLLDQALSIARETGDRSAEARILWNLTLVAARFGDPQDAVQYGEQALVLARELELRELIAFTLHDLFWAYLTIGKLEKARKGLDEAGQLWIELENKPLLADYHASLAFLKYYEGDFEQTLRSSAEGMRISKEINNLWGQAYNLTCTGSVYYERGEPAQAIHTMEECIQLAKEAGFWVPLTYTRVDLAIVYASLGSEKIALQKIEESRFEGKELPVWENSWYLSSIARVHAYLGDLNKAQSLLRSLADIKESSFVDVFYFSVWLELAILKKNYEQALTLAESMDTFIEQGLGVFLTPTLLAKGQALLRLARFDEARHTLQETISKAEEIQARRILWPAHTALAELEALTGNREKALDHHQKAIQLIYYLADNAANSTPSSGTGAELRASFLNLPEVKAALALQVSAYS